MQRFNAVTRTLPYRLRNRLNTTQAIATTATYRFQSEWHAYLMYLWLYRRL